MKRGLLALLATSALAMAASRPKVFTVGVALQLKQEHNTIHYLGEGVEIARLLYERAHPGIRIDLKSFLYSPDLISVSKIGKKIVAQKIPAVIGAELTEEALTLGEELNRSEIVLLTPTASNPRVTAGRKFVFQTCLPDTIVADRLAHFAAEKLAPPSVGIVQNVSSPYSDYLSTRFRETFQTLTQGRLPISVEKVLRGLNDFQPNIARLIERKTALVTLFTEDDDLLRFAAQSAKKGFAPTYLGADGWGNNRYVLDRIINETPEGVRFVGYRTYYWKDDATSPLTARFKAAHQKKYGREANAWAALAFDTAWALFEAMAKVADPENGSQIQRELRHTQLALTTTDRFSFGPDNAFQGPLYVYKISKDGFRYEATLK